jgi:hypothetical protein
MKMEAAGSSKTFVPIYQNTWHDTPENHNVNLLISRKSVIAGEVFVLKEQTSVTLAVE